MFTGVVAPLYNDLIEKGHILIAGMSGSGKSVIMHGLINSILYKSLGKHQMVLIDPKIVEFSRYRNTEHSIRVATSQSEIEDTLDGVLAMISRRFDYMEKEGLTEFDGTTVHLFVDELADLVLVSKSSTDKLQRICQIGRAAKIQVVAATQCPLASVIPTRIKVNFPIIIGLHTSTAQHSRNILETSGCECLPMYGQALIMYPTIGIRKTTIPMIPPEWLKKVIEADTKKVSDSNAFKKEEKAI